MIDTAFSASVTPCMGVWIETLGNQLKLASSKSHPVWVCGLKRFPRSKPKSELSHTLYGCVD